MSVEAVKDYLRRWNKADAVREFAVSSATVELAAEALGVLPARIAKSLFFRLKSTGECVLVLAAGDAKMDNAKFKQQFGGKGTMPPPEEVLELTGHPVGGVCPFALPRPGEIAVYLDVSLRRFETVFPAAGSGSSAVEMTCEELYECANASGWVDVFKDWADA